ncbi:MAG: SDR family oxidoreductase [Chitinophagales bacterium]|nr:SDR family oxidoreductase [Chitinophagales bacterium]
MYETSFHSKPLTQFTFLVTGGAGFIGSHLVEYLLKHGAAKVRVLDNLLTGRKENIELFNNHPAYEFQQGDIRNLDDCRKAYEGVDYVLHQAALASVQRSMKDPITTHVINADGFLNMLIAARDERVKRLVYASSSSVYGDHPDLPKQEHKTGNPLSPYAVSKKTNELYAHVFGNSFGLEIIGLRYFNVFGPRQDPDGPYAAVIPAFIRDLKNGIAPVIYGDGNQTRDFTFVENAVQANIKSLFTENREALNQVYNIAFGEPYSILQLFNLINEALKKNLQPQLLPSRTGDILHSTADISKAKLLIGYDPVVELKSGLKFLMQN